jgi:hypothetical protein
MRRRFVWPKDKWSIEMIFPDKWKQNLLQTLVNINMLVNGITTDVEIRRRNAFTLTAKSNGITNF